jgi:hypothetical protein
VCKGCFAQNRRSAMPQATWHEWEINRRSSTPFGITARVHSCKRDHAGPPLGSGTDIDVILPGEGELAICSHSEHRQARRQIDHLAFFPACAGSQRTRDQHACARVETEGAGMRGANISVLNRRRLPGLLVDREHRDVAFTRTEYHFAVHVLHPGSGSIGQARAIAQIDEAAIRMDMNRSSALDSKLVSRVRQRGLRE